MTIRTIVALLLAITITTQPNRVIAEDFIIKKKPSSSPANLSKDAIKERMGDAVRDAIHLLFDNATHLVAIQKTQGVFLPEACALHEKIIGLERKFSRIAESLIENHFVYKKNHKKRLETSLTILQASVSAFKQTDEQLHTKTAANIQKHLASISATLTTINEKVATDTCLKGI